MHRNANQANRLLEMTEPTTKNTRENLFGSRREQEKKEAQNGEP